VILLLISPDFMASDYCYSIEMDRALERHEAGEARVIPIILKSVDWTDAPFSKLQVLPKNKRAVTSWKDRNSAFYEIAADIRSALKELRASPSINRTPSSLQAQTASASPVASQSLASLLEEIQSQQAELAPVWNVPYRRNLLFTDREDILQQLHEFFAQDKAASSKQPLVLSGLGGMGKTQIALEYAYRYREEYHVILWAKADSEEALTSELASFATLLNVPGQHEQDQQYALAAVKRWLEAHSGWLLILDNVEDLKTCLDYLPATIQGNILLTTRSQVSAGVAQRLDIDKLGADDGAILLLRRVGLYATNETVDRTSGQYIQAAEIAVMLGGHPLAIDQAGAYLEENGANLSRYQELYRNKRAHLLKIRGNSMADHPESVATTLSLSFEKVEQANTVALELLCCLAFLHPDAIPDNLLEQGASQLGTLQAVVTDPFEFDRAIGDLRKYSLIRRNADGVTLTLHRLVQDVLKDSMDKATQRCWAERVVRAVNQAFPGVEFATWDICQQYLPQAQICSVLIETWQFAFPEAARLLYRTGRYLDERGQYIEAVAFITQSLTIRERVLGTEHLEVAESLHELAWLHEKQGIYRQGKPLLERALAIREKTLGPNHADVARSLNYLGRLYIGQGNYTEAESSIKRALAICEQVLGPTHPDTAMSLNDVAGLYVEQGNYTKGEPLLKRALAIREQVLGPTHPDTAMSLNNLALLYVEQGNYTEAEPLFKRALAIREQVLGPTHPDTATSLNNLAELHEGQGNYTEAESSIKRALAIFEQVLGPTHPDTAMSLSNLASLYNDQGNYTEAEPLLKRALAIREQVLGPTHSDTATSLNNLAQLYLNQGNYTEAEPLFKRALIVYEQTFGSKHPNLEVILTNYVSLLRATNRKGRAAEMEARLNILHRNMPKRVKRSTKYYKVSFRF
jgi:tetratricopeptide (TPR) repeat protein